MYGAGMPTAHAETVNYLNSELWALISQSDHQIT